MSLLQQQVEANALAISQIINNSVTYEELEAFVSGNPDDLIFTLRNTVDDKTLKLSVVQLIDLINSNPSVNLWRYIEGSEVKKATGNLSQTVLEVNDHVRFKVLSNGGFEVMLAYGIYDGGDKELLDSYTTYTMA